MIIVAQGTVDEPGTKTLAQQSDSCRHRLDDPDEF
jgi:hypothetical protein